MRGAQLYTGVKRTIQLYMSILNSAIQSALLMQKLLSRHEPVWDPMTVMHVQQCMVYFNDELSLLTHVCDVEHLLFA